MNEWEKLMMSKVGNYAFTYGYIESVLKSTVWTEKEKVEKIAFELKMMDERIKIVTENYQVELEKKK